MSEWISVKKAMPKHRESVLITDGETIVTASLDCDMPRVWWDAIGIYAHDYEFEFELEDVTHWMPLPEPPKENNNEQ